MTSSVISRLLILHIFQTLISPEPIQIFANSKRRFLVCHGILCDTPKENQKVNFDHSTTLSWKL